MTSEKTLLPFERLSNDIYARLECSCPYTTEAGQVIDFMTTRIQLVGYDDANFFDNVNREPRKQSCKKCGREFMVQWTREGVAVEWLDGGPVTAR